MLRGAIVGFGNVAQFGHWPAYRENSDARIVAIVDSNCERRAAASTLASSIAPFDSISDLAAKVAVDFVDICTPPALHAQQILEAIDARCHVLCEKPLLIESGAVETIARAAEAAGVAVVPVHNWKYAPIILRATELLRSGAIGSLRTVEITTLRTQNAAVVAGPNWRQNRAAAGGGILMDHGWHAIYLALHWFAETPKAIRADFHRPSEGEVEDEARATIEFPSGQAAISLSWNAASRENRIQLIGSAGEIAIDDDELRAGGETISFPTKLSEGSHHPDWFAAMLPDVVTAFRDPARAWPLFREAETCLRLIEQAYAASG